MSRNPLTARGRAEQLLRGIDPDALGHDAVTADIARATDSPAPRQLDAGERADATDDAVLVSLRSGARAWLAASWDEAARAIRTQVPDPVFQVLVDAVAGVLRECGARDAHPAAHQGQQRAGVGRG